MASMITIEPTIQAKGNLENLFCKSATNAGTISKINTTSTPASCTEEVTVSAKSVKKSISFASPCSL